jgi:hypothetical protein
MGSVTDDGTGLYMIALDTAFSDTNYWLPDRKAVRIMRRAQRASLRHGHAVRRMHQRRGLRETASARTMALASSYGTLATFPTIAGSVMPG